MVMVRFSGAAAIPKGTTVRLLVDNTQNPTKAYLIIDTAHGITFSPQDPTSDKLYGLAVEAQSTEGYVQAVIENAVIYSNSNCTDLTLSNVTQD